MVERKGLIDPRPPHSQGPGEHISLLLVAMGGMDIKGIPNLQPPTPSTCWLPESVSRWCIKFSEESRNKDLWDLISPTDTPWLQCEDRDTRLKRSVSPGPWIEETTIWGIALWVEWGLVGRCKERKCLTQAVCLFLFGFHYVVQAVLKLKILLPQSPWCRHYRQVPLCLVVWTRFWSRKVETGGR